MGNRKKVPESPVLRIFVLIELRPLFKLPYVPLNEKAKKDNGLYLKISPEVNDVLVTSMSPLSFEPPARTPIPNLLLRIWALPDSMDPNSKVRSRERMNDNRFTDGIDAVLR